jgi:peptidoglycan/xylan/chitin deacetylase (PgdA/CDA1 family)
MEAQAGNPAVHFDLISARSDAILGEMRTILRTRVLGFLWPLASSPAQASTPMAFTVDDLPSHCSLPEGESRTQIARSILKTLKAYQVPEVYGFVNAERIQQDPKHLRVEQFKKEIDRDETVLKALSASHGFDWHYFRYPYLNESENPKNREAIRAYLRKKGYRIAAVTDYFDDWAWNDPCARCKKKNNTAALDWLKRTYLDSAAQRFAMNGQAMDSSYHHSIPPIVLIHLGALDAEMLPSLLGLYRDRGVEFTPLSQAIQDPIYGEDLGYTSPAGGALQYQSLRAHGASTENEMTTPPPYTEQELSQLCTH